MKHQLWGFGLSLTILGGFTLPVLAQDDPLNQLQDITPTDLVSASYQGRFTDFGVPRHHALTTAFKSGTLSPESLVKSAIEAGRLAPETIDNQGYLNAVEDSLDNLTQN
ncbi:MAG: hypothetical protein AAFQ80_19535 [Cyanobacteria bacterium J06621_8]